MQYRHWSSRDGRRSSRPNYGTFGRGEVSNGFKLRPYRRPFLRRKEEILMKAGRLAAKYLVSKGLLPPSSIRPKWEDKKHRFDDNSEFKKRGREHRRNHGDDDYDDRMRRRRRRNDEYVSDRGRERGKWRKRDWGYDDVGGDRRRRFPDRHVGSEEMDNQNVGDDYGWKRGSLWSRKEKASADDLDLNRVVDGEGEVRNSNFGGGHDDVGSYESGEVREDDLLEGVFDSRPFEKEGDSKNVNDLLAQRGEGSSSNSRERPINYTIDLNQVASGGSSESDNCMDTSDDDLKGKNLCGESEGSSGSHSDMDISDVVLRGKNLCEEREGSSESEGDLKIDISDDYKGKSFSEDFDAAESYYISMHVHDLSKLCSFANVPTKPRTVGRRSSKIAPLCASKESNIIEIGSEVPKMIVGEDLVGGFSSESHTDQINTSKGEEYAVPIVTPIRYVEECLEQQQELVQSPASLGASFGSSRQTVNVNEETQLLGQPQKLELEWLSMDEELAMGCVVDQEKPVPDYLFPKSEPELNAKMEEEKHLPTIYKVCDLNLMAPPEVIEVQDDPVLDHLHTSLPVCEASRELPVAYPSVMDNRPRNTNSYSQHSGGNTISVINLEDDSSPESNAYDSLEPKSETTYSSLASLTENADLQGAYNGCFPAISELRQIDIFVRRLAPSDLDNPQAGMGIPGSEVLGRFEAS